MSPPEASQGLFASLRKLLASGLETLKVRLELLSVEIEQEKLRLFDALLWFGFALLLLGIGLLFTSALIVLVMWESHRLLALGMLAAFFLLTGAWLMYAARQRLRVTGGLFASSVVELTQDQVSLDGTH